MPIKPRLARLDEAGAIMAFIRDHWSADHVLARSRELFDWQHRDEAAGRYNFVVASESDDISAILGFIPASRYDTALRGSDTVWLTTWKARADRASGTGLRLLLSMQRDIPFNWIGTVGLNAATRGIYDALGYVTGRLSRFFVIHPRMRDFYLAQIPTNRSRPALFRSPARFAELSAADFLTRTQMLAGEVNGDGPRKTPAQFLARYLEHPFYDYQAWLLEREGAQCVLIIRACRHDGHGALRVVDFLGASSVLEQAYNVFEELLVLYEAEYLDFFCSGLDAELRSAGLLDVADVPELILPGHFEPFERRNVELLYSLKGPDCRNIVCKGDADQDRPNLLDIP